jgi:hypothetical protein
MKLNDFLQVVGSLFIVIAVLHVARLLMGWEIVIGGYAVPIWVSFIGAAVAGFLGYTAFKLEKK